MQGEDSAKHSCSVCMFCNTSVYNKSGLVCLCIGCNSLVYGSCKDELLRNAWCNTCHTPKPWHALHWVDTISGGSDFLSVTTFPIEFKKNEKDHLSADTPSSVEGSYSSDSSSGSSSSGYNTETFIDDGSVFSHHGSSGSSSSSSNETTGTFLFADSSDSSYDQDESSDYKDSDNSNSDDEEDDDEEDDEDEMCMIIGNAMVMPSEISVVSKAHHPGCPAQNKNKRNVDEHIMVTPPRNNKQTKFNFYQEPPTDEI